jgi:hypothetical protein
VVPSGENATDLIRSLCAFVFWLSSSSLSARQASTRQFWPRRGDSRAPWRTKIPDFDRLVARSGYNLGPVRGKRNRLDLVAVRVQLLAQQLQFACQTSQQSSVLAKEGRFEGSVAPASQTLIVLSADPDTILVPSGENSTDMTQWLWALVFSLSSSSLAVRQAIKRQFWPRRGDFGLAAHPNPRL